MATGRSPHFLRTLVLLGIAAMCVAIGAIAVTRYLAGTLVVPDVVHDGVQPLRIRGRRIERVTLEHGDSFAGEKQVSYLLTCPSGEPPAGATWVSNRRFPAGIEIYEYTPGMIDERDSSKQGSQRWSGLGWNRAQTPEKTLQHFAAGRMYHVRGIAPFTLSCSDVSCTGTGCGLSVGYNANGLETIDYRGWRYADLAAQPLDAFVLKNESGAWLSATEATSRSWDPQTKTRTLTFPSMTVRIAYAQTGDDLDVTASVENTSTGSIAFPIMRLFYMRFPGNIPTSIGGISFNTNQPAVSIANVTGATIAVVDTNSKHQFYSGFGSQEYEWWGAGDANKKRYAVMMSGIQPYEYGGVTSDLPWILPQVPRLAPGDSMTHTVSLRFGPQDMAKQVIGGDAYDAWREAFPDQFGWQDRRPIGGLFPSTVVLQPDGTLYPVPRGLLNHEKNPRGWIFSNFTTDITTPAGLAKFHDDTMAYADASIAELKRLNAQGMIVWNIEGNEFGQIQYICNPPLISRTAPEMDAIADEFFKKFRDAGLRVGTCIQPIHDVVFPTTPGVQPYWVNTADPVQILIDEIGYARKRWGATLFYMDSDGDQNFVMWPEIFRRVHERFPDVLILAEHSYVGHHAYMTAYNDAVGPSYRTTPSDFYTMYPDAFSVVSVFNTPTDPNDPLSMQARIGEFTEGLRNGDIMMFSGWYSAPPNNYVRDLYRSVYPNYDTLTADAFSAGPFITVSSSAAHALTGPGNLVVTYSVGGDTTRVRRVGLQVDEDTPLRTTDMTTATVPVSGTGAHTLRVWLEGAGTGKLLFGPTIIPLDAP